MFHPLSLLDILAGRKSRKGVAGEVLINRQGLPKNYKCASGYVVQVCVYGDMGGAILCGCVYEDGGVAILYRCVYEDGGVAILYRCVYEDGGGAILYGCVQDLCMPVISFVPL